MQKIIEAAEAGTRERERLAYEWNILQETGNAARIEAAAEEIVSARQKGYLPLSGEHGGRYLLSAGDFIVGGAANCSYLLFRAGVTRVDALKFDLPFEQFLNPLKRGETELSLVPRPRETVEPTEENLLRLLIEKGIQGARILRPRKIMTAEGEAQPLRDILAPTNGHLVYQEQLLHLLHRMGGISYAEADLLRRALSKNRPVSFEKFSEGAMLGYREKDIRALEKYIYEEISFLYPKAYLLALALGQGEGNCQKGEKTMNSFSEQKRQEGIPEADSEAEEKTRDRERFEEYLEEARSQDDTSAQFYLGVCYYFGIGTEKDLPKAVEWFQKAALRGVAEAQFNLGNCYCRGDGVACDEKTAMEWWEKAALQGHPTAQCNLGIGYYCGRGAVQDFKKAVEWFKRAAEQEHAEAQYNLGVCYRKGYGIEQDCKKRRSCSRKRLHRGLKTQKERWKKSNGRFYSMKPSKNEAKRQETLHLLP